MNLHASALDTDAQSIAYAITTEPPNLNSLTATDQVSFFILLHTQEGLLTVDEYGVLSPAVAERWSFNGTKAVFHLRKDIKWSDGKPITAEDFVFSWRTALDPKTASPYAFIMYPLKNAEKINNGQLPTTALGVKAINKHTLEVTLQQPTAYFLSLTTFPTYYPVREDIYNQFGDRYAAEAGNMIGNGAFILTEWVHGASLKLVRNPNYWNHKKVSLKEINIPHITNDPGTLFNLFLADESVLADLTPETVKQAMRQRMFIQAFKTGALTYLEFNHRQGYPTANLALRQAIRSVIDKEELVYKVIGAPGSLAAKSFFPSWLIVNNKSFHQAYPPEPHQPDYERAQRLMQQAKEELKFQEPLVLTLLIYDTPSVVKQAEYLQNLLKTRLNIELKIDRQIFKQKLAKMKSGNFDIVLAAWGPDFNDPMTFGDLLHSKNANNHGAYYNQLYDAAVQLAASSEDNQQRFAAFNSMQRLIEADVAVIPLTERGSIYVQRKQLRGVARRIFGGDPDFRFAYLSDTRSESSEAQPTADSDTSSPQVQSP